MLTYSFENLGNDSLYEYLYKCIRQDILNGTLTAGTKLPSKRTFAANLNISTITVENAYAQLLAEGYIYSIPKKGYYVSEIIPEPVRDGQVSEQQHSTLPQNNPSYFTDIGHNQTNPENFPFTIWAKLMREIIIDKSRELMTNPPCGGIPELREAISGHLLQFRGIHVSPEQIIIGAGTEYLYGLIIQLLGHDKIFAVEDPGYKKIASIYKCNNVECRHIPLDQDGISIQALEQSDADIIHISPSHHYPTGIITPISRRYELLAWALKSDSRYIIEDDYDSEFRLMGKPIPSMQSIDVSEKVIYINTFTKSLSSTIRISYMILPGHLLDKFYRKLSFYACTVSNFEQYTLAKFIQEGYFEKHINRMRNSYRNQRNAILECIKKSSLSSIATIMEEDSGLHFLIKLDTIIPDHVLQGRMKKEELKISFLSQYYFQPNPDAEHIIVMNYSGMDQNLAEIYIHKLCKCIL
ncbi:MAG: PLP-dependent aminotransferase family protein [Lachnospiraceae bacterium]|nr:PLP-dependent aminotransferase family protein [Lachnospiraceae bacterium]